MKNVLTHPLPWLIGTLIAFVGVAVARLVAPTMPADQQMLVTLGGRLLAVAGLLVLMFGIHRRIRTIDPDPSPSTDETLS